MKRYVMSLLLAIAAIATSAQQKQRKFYLIPQVALLNGDHAKSWQWQLIGGVQKKQWAFGLGCGMDYYKSRSIPVFTDTRFFFGKKNACFSYFNLGYNIASPMPWQKRVLYSYWPPSSSTSEYSNGLYTGIGLGYILNASARRKLMLSAGYGFKTVAEHYNTLANWSGYWPPGTIMQKSDYDRTINYWLNYFSLKLGISLW